MFSVTDRETLRRKLIAYAERDPQIVAAALVGSAARDAEDRWSDIDLALRLAPEAAVDEVAEQWTRQLGSELAIVDTLDVQAFDALYRVFLLDSTLQVDLSFFPHDSFHATNGEAFHVLFGAALPAAPRHERDWRAPLRSGWLYLLHARSAIARDRLWQAELMLSEVRATVLSLAAQRHELRSDHGREAHRLSFEITDPLAAARAATIDRDELFRSLRATAACFLYEVGQWDPDYRERLEATIHEIGKPAEDIRTRRRET